MGLITDLPEDLPTTDALADIYDSGAETGGERAEIYLSGAHVATLDNAPAGRERITLMVELEVTEESIRFSENGDIESPIRRCRRVGDMWREGTPKPPSKEDIAAQVAAAKAKAAAEWAAQEDSERAEAEDNQPPMFDEDGDSILDAAADSPSFSDGSK